MKGLGNVTLPRRIEGKTSSGEKTSKRFNCFLEWMSEQEARGMVSSERNDWKLWRALSANAFTGFVT